MTTRTHKRIRRADPGSEQPRYPLATLRWNLGLTQAQLARKIQVNRSTIHCWEAGTKEPRPAYRTRYAAALGVSIRQLAAAVYATSMDNQDTHNKAEG